MRPLLRSKEYGPALLLAVRKVRGALESPPPQASSWGWSSFISYSSWACVALVAFYCVCEVSNGWRACTAALGVAGATLVAAGYGAAAAFVVSLLLSENWPAGHVACYGLVWAHCRWWAPAIEASGWASTRTRLLAIEHAHAARLGGGGDAGAAALAPPAPPVAFDAPTCSICLEDLVAPGTVAAAVAAQGGPGAALTLPCRHRFHAACLDLAFGAGVGRNTCPLCRAPAFPQVPGAAVGGEGAAAAAAAQGDAGGPGDGRRGWVRGALDAASDSVSWNTHHGVPAAAAHVGAAHDDSLTILRQLHGRYPDAVPWTAVARVAEATPPGADIWRVLPGGASEGARGGGGAARAPAAAAPVDGGGIAGAVVEGVLRGTIEVAGSLLGGLATGGCGGSY